MQALEGAQVGLKSAETQITHYAQANPVFRPDADTRDAGHALRCVAVPAFPLRFATVAREQAMVFERSWYYIT